MKMKKFGEAWNAVKRGAKKVVNKVLGVGAVALGLKAATASAAVDTTVLDGVVADCGVWITYGVTSFLTLLGAGLTIVAATWVYRKVKAGIKSN